MTETNIWSGLSSPTVLQPSGKTSVSVSIASLDTSLGRAANITFSLIGTSSLEEVNSTKSHTPLAMGKSHLMTTLNYTVIQPKRKTGTLIKTAKTSTATVTPTTVAATATSISPVLSFVGVNKNSSLHFETDSTSMNVTANMIPFQTKSFNMTSLAGTKSDRLLPQQGNTAPPGSRFITRVAKPSPTPSRPSDSPNQENLSTSFISLQNTGTIVSSSQLNESKESLFVTTTVMATASHTLSELKGFKNGSSSQRIKMSSYGFSYPTAFISESLLKVGTKTLSTHAHTMPFSDIFAGVNRTRSSVSVPSSTTVMGLSQPMIQSKSSMVQGVAFSRISKATNAISTAAFSYNSTVTGISSPVIQSKTSMIQQITPKHPPYSSELDAITKSVAVSSRRNSTVNTPTLSIVQNKTSSSQMLTFSEITNVTVTNVAAFDNSTIGIASLSPFVKSEQSLMHDISSSKIYKRAVNSSEANVPRTSGAVPLSTITSSPQVQHNTFSTHVITPSDIFKITSVSLGVSITTRSAPPVFNNETVISSSLPIVEDETSQLQMISSSKNSESTQVFSSVHTPRTILEVSYSSTIMGPSLPVVQSVTFTGQKFSSSTSTKTTNVFSKLNVSKTSVAEFQYSRITGTRLAMEQSKTVTIQGTNSSEIAKVQTSKMLFSSAKVLDNVSFVSSKDRLISENTKKKLTRTVYMTPASYPSVQATIVKTETTTTAVLGSTFITRLLTEGAFRHSSKMTTNFLHDTTRVTSSILINRAPESSFTVQPPSTDSSVITNTPMVTDPTSTLRGTTSMPDTPISQTVVQKTGSITSRLPTSVNTFESAVSKSRKTLMPTLTGGAFTAYQTISSSISSSQLLSNTDTLTDKSTATGKSLLTDKSSITSVSESSSLPKSSSFTIVTSTPLPFIILSRHIISISTSLSSQTRKESTVTVVSIFPSKSHTTATTAHDELVRSASTKQWTFSSNHEGAPTTKPTLTSTESSSLLSTVRSSIITLLISFSPTPTSSALVAVQTRPPTENPRQFEGSMILQMPWNPQYQNTYTPEFQALASQITRELTKALRTLENFLSVQVLRLWKGSVGIDFVVFMRQSVQLNETTVKKTLIEANSTGVLDLPMTSLQVNERSVTTTSSSAPTSESKSLERWEIVLVVSGIVVFLLLLIVCILAVSDFQINFVSFFRLNGLEGMLVKENGDNLPSSSGRLVIYLINQLRSVLHAF